jgi:hypothetical protein
MRTDHKDREEYTSDASYGSDGPEIVDSNQDNLEVPTVSHNVPVNQLSSPVDSILESHESLPFEPLKELPNRVTRGKPKVNYESVLHSKFKYHMNNYVSYHRLSKEKWHLYINYPLYLFLTMCRKPWMILDGGRQ